MQKKLDYEKYLNSNFSNEIINMITKIYEFKGKSELFSISNPDVLEKLTKMAKIQSVDASNRIEGIFTSDKRLREIVMSKATPINRDESEIAGYRSAIELIHTSYEYMDITPNVILQIHKIMYEYSGSSIGGKFKTTENVIEEKDIFGNKTVRFIPVKAFQTKEYLTSLCEEYNSLINQSIIDPLFIIPIFIFDFLCIHPFSDGNGRMSRLLTLLLLYKSGYYVGKYISIEKVIEATKGSYYDVLQISNDGWHEGNNDVKPFIKYYLGTIIKAYRTLEERYILVRERKISNLERVYNYIEESITPVSKREIVDVLTDISQITVERQLSLLFKSNRVEKIGTGRSTQYVVS